MIAFETNVVDSAKGRDINGLTTDGSGTTDAGGVLARASVDDGIDQHLERVLMENNVTEKVHAR